MKFKYREGNDFGKLVMIIGVLMAVPLLMIPFYPGDIVYAFDFIVPSLFSIVFGYILYRNLPGCDSEERIKNFHRGALIVLCTWLYGFFIGAMPFVISGQLTLVQGIFEAVSGWTTTGLSVMEVDKTAHIFLFHRGFMQYCGGVGFVMVMISFLKGKQIMNLYSAEGHPDKLSPNLGKTARIILLMYNFFLVVGTIAYIVFGMDPFDSIVHAMCALSTGGFSNKVDSIGAYNSFPIELITIILMIIGTTNFAALLLFAKGKFKQFWRVSEVRFMTLVISVGTLIVAIALVFDLNISLLEGLRISLFNVVSALSTSGFATMPYTLWSPFAVTMLTVLMIIGGGIGSTAGALKLSRVYLMLRIVKENIKKRIGRNHSVSKPYYYKAQGKTYIDQELIEDVFTFFFCYMVIYIVGSLLITVTANCSLMDAMFDFASSLGTVGLSIGITNPTTNDATLLIEIFGMLMGRLEIFIVIIGAYSGFARIKNMFKR
ncbi:MAG: TrkH family potassium uptake protein [Erysipelotrichaceae bacterium]